jgi:hypothetical protein
MLPTAGYAGTAGPANIPSGIPVPAAEIRDAGTRGNSIRGWSCP